MRFPRWIDVTHLAGLAEETVTLGVFASPFATSAAYAGPKALPTISAVQGFCVGNFLTARTGIAGRANPQRGLSSVASVSIHDV